MTAYRSILVTIAALAAATQLSAAEAPRAKVDDLRAAKEKLARAAEQQRGTPRAWLEAKTGRSPVREAHSRVDRLIGALEKGEPVDPAEIDRALEEAERLSPSSR